MIAGADFTTLAEVEANGGRFYDYNGREIDLVEFLASQGITSARLRLWLDPYGKNGEPYLGGTTDEKCVMGLVERADRAGMSIMLDLHYSDFWADPGRQMIPKVWQGMESAAMADALYEYTARTLDRFVRTGADIESVQVGNEITNGMLWPAAALTAGKPRRGYDELARFLRRGTEAVRTSSDALSILHLENSGNNAIWTEWFDEITARGVVFDEIGASYYPYWHGSLEAMRDNLSAVAERYDRDIRIVETSYAFTSNRYPTTAKDPVSLCMTNDDNTRFDGFPMPYAATPEGQCDYLRALFSAAASIPGGRCKGIYWWEPAWIPAGSSGWASDAALGYCHEEGKKKGNEWANQCLFDYSGHVLPALKFFGQMAK